MAPPVEPQFPPVQPLRKKRGILHDVQLSPFEYMESVARQEVTLSQTIREEEPPHPLLPKYDSQPMYYTQTVADPQMQILLPEYESQETSGREKDQGGEGTPGARLPASARPDTTAGQPAHEQQPAEEDNGSGKTQRGTKQVPTQTISGIHGDRKPKDAQRGNRPARRTQRESTPAPARSPPERKKRRIKPAERRNAPGAKGSASDDIMKPHDDNDTIDLHETILAAPMTETSPTVDYGGQPARLPTDDSDTDASERSEEHATCGQRLAQGATTAKRPGQ